VSPVTVGERILVHLSWYLRYSDAFECPRETTQDGIADALGISRAHAALELKRLKASSKAEERMAHVAGARSRRKVYFLTPSGAGAARALREYARAKPVLLADGAGRREVPGAEAIESLKARGVREPEATQLVLGGDVVEPRPRPGPERDLPTAEPFVGREEELAALRAWLASPAPLALVLGVPGIGKTALAARAASDWPGPVWYRKVYGFDDARTFASALGDFLHRIERPRLRSYLSSGGFDGDGLSAILREDLSGVLVVADDVHASMEAAGFLRLAVDAGGSGKLLVTARERPDVLAGGRRDGPVEVVLGGLDPAASRALASRLLPGDPERIDRIVAAGRGHPIALHVLAAVDPPAGPAGAERLLEDAILEGLDPSLERAAVSLAVLRAPIGRPADLGVSATGVRGLAGRGLLARGPGGIALHDLVKDVLLPRTSAPVLRRAHAAASRAALRQGDPIEAAWHATASGRPRRARDILVAARGELLDSPRVGELTRLLLGLPRTSAARLLLAEGMDRLGRGDESRALLRGIVEGPGHPRRAEALLLLGRIESRRNALAEAQRVLREAITAAERSSLPGIEGKARRILAVVHRKLGDYDAATEELGRAIPLLERARERREGVSARLDGAVIRLLRGEVQDAATELEGLLEDPAAGPREGAAIRSNLAIAWVRMGRPAEAAALFEESARAAEEAGDFRAAGYALANAADAHLDAGRPEDAEASLARARQVSDGFADPLLESTVLTNEGKVLAAQGRPGPAEERLRAGVERIRGLGNVASLIERIDELARFYERSGRPEEADMARRDLEGLRGSLPRGRVAAGPP